MALGIGAAIAIFSIVNVVLLRPLPIRDPDRLVVLATQPGDHAASPAMFVHWRAQSSVLEDVSAFVGGVANYTGGDSVEQWHYTRASAGIFPCFRMKILRGRTFAPAENLPNGSPVAVISEELWKHRFASDPGMIGKTISLDGQSHTVIGIVSGVPALRGYGPFGDVYIPFQIDSNTSDQGEYFEVAARLKPAITLARAKAGLRDSTIEYRAKFPNILGPKDTFTVRPFRKELVGGDDRLLKVLFGAVTLVLLIACANVANLSLLRASNRRREIAVRAAIGAARMRIIRQLLTESVLLAVVAGVLGLVVGFGGIKLLLAVTTADLTMVGKNGAAVTADWRVVTFALFLSLITGVVFGLFPAIQSSRVDLNLAMQDGGTRAGTGIGQSKTRALLVVSEISLAVVLMVGSALLIRTFLALYTVDLGFDSKKLVTVNTRLSGPKYSKAAAVTNAVRTSLERLRSLPGVVAASATCCLPLAQGTWDMNFDIIGRPAMLSSASQNIGWLPVSPGYFDVFKIPVMRGRAISKEDDSKSPAVVVISERMAEQFWKGKNPVGDRIVIGRGAGLKGWVGEPVRQVVGVVGNIRSEALQDTSRAVMYVPQAQLTDAENGFVYQSVPITWVVRTQSSPSSLIPIVKDQLRHVTGLPVTDVALMDQVVWGQTARQRFSMLLMSIFGSVALLLAAIGIYGLIAYMVEQRRREIGIRMALGAESRNVRNMIAKQGVTLVLVGLAAGLGAAWVLSRLFESLLFGVKAHDVMVFVAVPVLLAVVAFVAVYLPANRASRINPVESLRGS